MVLLDSYYKKLSRIGELPLNFKQAKDLEWL